MRLTEAVCPPHGAPTSSFILSRGQRTGRECNGKSLRDAVRQALCFARKDGRAGWVRGQQRIAGGLPICAGQLLCVSFCLAGVHTHLCRRCAPKGALRNRRHVCTRYLRHYGSPSARYGTPFTACRVSSIAQEGTPLGLASQEAHLASHLRRMQVPMSAYKGSCMQI